MVSFIHIEQKNILFQDPKPPPSDSPAARYLAALSPAGGVRKIVPAGRNICDFYFQSLLGGPACRGTVSLGHSVTVRPSVRQTQQLLLQKTGGLPSKGTNSHQFLGKARNHLNCFFLFYFCLEYYVFDY